MFGVSVGYIGMSLTYGIVMGLCSLAGALIPLATRFDQVVPASLPFIFLDSFCWWSRSSSLP